MAWLGVGFYDDTCQPLTKAVKPGLSLCLWNLSEAGRWPGAASETQIAASLRQLLPQCWLLAPTAESTG